MESKPNTTSFMFPSLSGTMTDTMRPPKLVTHIETCLNHVHFVPDDIFQKLTEGAVYPGIVNNYSAQQRINILYDFIDISVTLRSRMDYKAIYGEEFFETQELVKQRLSK